MATDVPWNELFEAAAAAQRRAYAPYSKFPVGAAVLADDGQIYSGCNVENASYGLSVCAERNAIGRAVTEGARAVKAVAIIANAPSPTPPCGTCRQVIAEFASENAPVHYRNPTGEETRSTVGELLPHAFNRDFL